MLQLFENREKKSKGDSCTGEVVYWIFQHGNTLIHTVNSTCLWYVDNESHIIK